MFKNANETWEEAAMRRKVEVLEWRIDVLRKKRAIIKKRIKAVKAAMRGNQSLSEDEICELQDIIDDLEVQRENVKQDIVKLRIE